MTQIADEPTRIPDTTGYQAPPPRHLQHILPSKVLPTSSTSHHWRVSVRVDVKPKVDVPFHWTSFNTPKLASDLTWLKQLSLHSSNIEPSKLSPPKRYRYILIFLFLRLDGETIDRYLTVSDIISEIRYTLPTTCVFCFC